MLFLFSMGGEVATVLIDKEAANLRNPRALDLVSTTWRYLVIHSLRQTLCRVMYVGLAATSMVK